MDLFSHISSLLRIPDSGTLIYFLNNKINSKNDIVYGVQNTFASSP